MITPSADHYHKFERLGNDYVCSCGKRMLAFEHKEESNTKVGVRKNGRKYTKKADTNRYFTPNEWMTFEDYLKPAMRHTCKMLLNTGARIMELQKAQVRDFIYNPSGRSTLVLRNTKTKARKGEFGSGKPRTIPISKQFAKYLADYIKNNNLKPEEGLNISSTPAVNIAMKLAATNAKLNHPEDFSAHNLRKTLEVWLMALGVDGLALTAHIGHDMKTAASHYVSPDVFSWDDKNKMRQIIGDLYEQRR